MSSPKPDLLMSHAQLFYVQLSRAEIKELQNDDFKFEKLKRTILNPQDFQQIDSYHNIENKLTFIANKLLCRKACISYLGNEKELEFDKTLHGKPYVKHYPLLKFNMSNCISQCATTMVINNQGFEMGIDIANVKDHMLENEAFDFTLYNDILSSKERHFLSQQVNIEDRIRLFAMIWATKESYTKLIGLGLTHKALNTVSVLEHESHFMFEKVYYPKIIIDSQMFNFKLYWVNDNKNVICVCQRATETQSSEAAESFFPENIKRIDFQRLLSPRSLSLLGSPNLLLKKHKVYISLHSFCLPQKATCYAPNRLTLIFYNLLSMKLLGMKNTDSDGHLTLIKALYIESEDYIGFTPDRRQFPNGTFGISQTFFAILNLLLLGVDSFDFIDVDKLCLKLVEQIKECDDVRDLYMSCGVLFLFNKLDLLGLNYILEILNKKCFVEKLGFINFGKGELHSGYISCIASIYKLLKIKYGYELEKDKKELVFEWLCHRQIVKDGDASYPGNGGFNGRENKYVDPCYSFWNLSAMDYFQVTDEIPYDLVMFEKYVFQMQDTLKGGFGKLLPSDNDDSDCVESDLFHTFTTLCSLGVLDGILDTTLCLPNEVFHRVLVKNNYL